MKMNEYQALARSTAIYPRIGSNFLYPVVGFTEETGEVAGHIKRIARDDHEVITDERRGKLKLELGDCFWYLANAMAEGGLPLSAIGLADGADQELDEFQLMSAELHHYPLQGSGSLDIPMLGLSRAAGRISESQWLTMDPHAARWTEEGARHLYGVPDDLREGLVWLSAFAAELGFTLSEIAQANVDKVASRKARGTLHGSGDVR